MLQTQNLLHYLQEKRLHNSQNLKMPKKCSIFVKPFEIIEINTKSKFREID